MSQLTLRRKHLSEKSTVGELYLPSGEFFCHTLEDVVRSHKVPGKTAIPAGEFEVVIAWSNRYARAMPRLLDVPFYSGILIHPLNVAEQTEGCVGVGRYDDNVPDFIGHSRDTFDLLFPVLRKLTEKGKTFLKIDGGYPAAEWGLVP